MVELLQHSLQQPESNPELFYFVERSLQELDKGSDGVTANLPLLFSLQLAVLLGFQLQGNYSATFYVLDLQEGQFVRERPTHPYFIEGNAASVTARLYQITSYDQLENMQLDRNQRRELLENYLQFYALHIHDFGTLRSLPVLKEVLQ
jgi:DNA repair protein RecO (recombination protein O)